MMTFFFAGLYHQVYSHYDENRERTGRKATALFFYLLALLSKPSAVGFPLMIVVVDAVLEKEAGILAFLHKRLTLYAGYFALTLAYSLLYLKIAAGPDGMGLENVAEGVVIFNGSLPQLVGQQISSYVAWAFWPVKLTHYPLFELAETYASFSVLAGLSAGLLLIVSAVYCIRRAPLATVAIGLFFAGLLPVIGQAPFRQYYEVRYLLISVAAPALLAAWFFAYLATVRLKIVAWTTMASLLFFWTVFSLRDIPAWASTETLWMDALAKEPRLWIAHRHLGLYYVGKGLVAKADAQADACLKINPTSEDCICIKAMTTFYLKSREESLKLLENSMQYNRTGKIGDNMALVLLKMGHKEKAMEVYARNMENRAVHASDLAQYAAFMLSIEEPEKALELFLKAREIRENGAYDYEREIKAVREAIEKKNSAPDEPEKEDSGEKSVETPPPDMDQHP